MSKTRKARFIFVVFLEPPYFQRFVTITNHAGQEDKIDVTICGGQSLQTPRVSLSRGNAAVGGSAFHLARCFL